MSGPTLEFKKIPALLHRLGVGRQLAPVRTLGQHHPDTEILDNKIVCILFASFRTLGKHRPDVVLLWQLGANIVQLSRL
jgi:hypothetical protein